MKAFFRLVFFLAVVAAAIVSFLVFSRVSPPGDTFVQIKPGSSGRQIARELENAHVIRSRWAFLALHYLEGRGPLKAGEYLFRDSANAIAVYDRIVRGDIYTTTVVIPEGFNVFDIADAVESAKLCSRQQFLAEARQTALVADLDPQAKSLEGYLFPDTYRFSRTQSVHDMAAEMVKRFRKEAQALGLLGNPELRRIVTMASIVEKETSVDTERPLVAGVFYNRLEKGIGLATDPSVIYASLLAGKFDGVIRQSDLALESPYNTYRHAGLPPGPIANPGRESLQAALHPTKTDYLYFVANNRGGHNFSKTIDEHNRNVASYRKGLQQ